MAKLYVLPASVNCHSAQVLIDEAGLQIETVTMDLMKGELATPEFLAKNPFGYVPTLFDKGAHIWESNTVLRYLCNANDLSDWYPTEPKIRAKIEQFLDFRQTSYAPQHQAFVYPAFGISPNVEGMEPARKNLLELMDQVITFYLKDSPFLCGMDHPTIADLSFGITFSHLAVHKDFTLPAPLKAYQERLDKACPSWARIRQPVEGFIAYIHSQKASKIYVIPFSVNCHGPQILIAEAGLPFQTVALDFQKGETRTPEFLAKNPFHCVPTIFDKGTHIWESNAIMRYFCNSHNLNNWYPAEPKIRAKIEQFLDFRQTSYYKAQSDLVYPAMGLSTDFSKAEQARKDVLELLETVAAHYLKAGKFLCDVDHPTIADLSFACLLPQLGVIPDFVLPTAIKSYVERVAKAVPSWAAIRAPTDQFVAEALAKKSGATTETKAEAKEGKDDAAKAQAKAPEGKEGDLAEGDYVELFGLSNAVFNGQQGVVRGVADGRFQIKLQSRELVRIKPENLKKISKPKLTADALEESNREQAMVAQQTQEAEREKKFRRCAEVKDRKYHLRTYPHCFVGRDTVTALVNSQIVKTRPEAVAFGNKVMEAGVFFHVSKEHTFKDDNLYYRFATSESLLNVGPRFWNIRGSFLLKAGGVAVADAGTHMSIVQLPNGNYIVLDTISLTDAAKKEIDELTSNGKKIEAVFALHPYHTLWFPAFYKLYPGPKYYGCPRHLTKIPAIPWAGNLVEEKTRQLYEPYLTFRISQGSEFVNPATDNHVASVVCLHKESATMHVDDTFMYWSNPNFLLRLAGLKQNTMSLHLTINSNLSDPMAFKAWTLKLLEDWEFDNMCCAHTGNRIGGAKKMLQNLMIESEARLQKLAADRAKGTKPEPVKKEECQNVEGDECG